ncbi:MAG: RsmG family class I SAM-dependent methyltransferase [Bacillota bacterium]|jgi:16S rRNA (guanine527-N7)-methyltransferase
MGLPQTESALSLVESWFRFYRTWQGRRVVGFTDPEDIAVKLIADSFAILHAVPDITGTSPLRVVDLGSGNGWPGLAAVALWPDSLLTLIDSRLGACDFILEYLTSASIERALVVPQRAEEASKSADFRGQFDLVTSRAMAQPGVSLELSVPFGCPGSLVALWLGPEYAAKVAGRPDIPELGVRLLRTHEYVLARGRGRRVLAVYRCEAAPRKGYPRNLSSIKAKPLL